MSDNATPLPPVDLSESRGGSLAAQIIALVVISAITVALRIYTRFFVIKKRFVDDYLILAALVSRLPRPNRPFSLIPRTMPLTSLSQTALVYRNDNMHGNM